MNMNSKTRIKKGDNNSIKVYVAYNPPLLYRSKEFSIPLTKIYKYVNTNNPGKIRSPLDSLNLNERGAK